MHVYLDIIDMYRRATARHVSILYICIAYWMMDGYVEFLHKTMDEYYEDGYWMPN